MQIKEIDTLNAQPFQGGMAAAGQVIGLIIDGAGIGLLRRTLNATFGGDGEFQPFGLVQPGKKTGLSTARCGRARKGRRYR